MKKNWFRNWFLPAFIFASTLTLSHLFALVIKNEEMKLGYFDIASALINALATAMLFLAARRTMPTSHRLGMAWLFFALAQLVYTLGDIIWMVLELVLHTSPYPSTADIFYLLNYPLFMAGAFLITERNSIMVEYFERSLDILITLVAAVLGMWLFLVEPMLSMAISQTPLLSILTVAYPAGDIVLFISLIWLFNRDPKRFSTIPMLFMFIGIVATMIFDTIYSYQSYIGTYKSGGVIDLGWILSYLMIGLAGYSQILAQKENPADRHRFHLERMQRAIKKATPYLPYVWMLFAYVLLFIGSGITHTRTFTTLYIGVGVIIVLVIFRQFIALYKNSILNRDLLSALEKVQTQSKVLETTNQELEAEIFNRITVEEQLSYDARHDSLTDLPNRISFTEKLKLAIAESRTSNDGVYSVLYMDVDQFKVINDSLGHHMGDELLKVIAFRLKSCFRSSDAVARLGGDEFVFLIENTQNENSVETVINRIQTELANVIVLDNHPVYITTSIGVVWNLRGYDSPENVLRDADLAMYHAKHMGKDRYEVFHEGLRLKMISRMELEDNLRKAIKHHELELNYQPIYSLLDNRISGFEALLRWNSPSFGLVYPSDFLPVAEETGLSLSIGNWCLTEACRQAKHWQEEWPDLRECYFSINISVKQFTSDGFINKVRNVLTETAVEPTTIRLEITENALIEYSDEVIKKIKQLDNLGIRLSIDDFGTGYSSLSYLKDIPAVSLKIDQSFTREIGINKNSMDLIKTMIALGQNLDMEVIAEGIESMQQLQELIDLKCRYGQGFLLSLPLKVEEMEEILSKKSLGLINHNAE